jgi:hypothetical protein
MNSEQLEAVCKAVEKEIHELFDMLNEINAIENPSISFDENELVTIENNDPKQKVTLDQALRKTDEILQLLQYRNVKNLIEKPKMTKSIKDMTKEEIVALARELRSKDETSNPFRKELIMKKEEAFLKKIKEIDVDHNGIASGDIDSPTLENMAKMFNTAAKQVLLRGDGDMDKEELLARGVTLEKIAKDAEQYTKEEEEPNGQ